MIDSDYKFWQNAVDFWHTMAEYYLEIGDNVSAARCTERADLSLNRRKEANGEILVYGPEIYARGA